MKKSLLLLLMLFLFSLQIYSHYQWIVYRTEITGQVSKGHFMIGCGHMFPESELLLKRDMISGVFLRKGENSIPLNINENGKFWEGYVEKDNNLPYIIEYTLTKRISKKPFFLARALVSPPDFQKSTLKIFTGKGLEIIPENLHMTKKTDHLTFKTYIDGNPVPAKLIVFPEGKKPLYLYPDRNCQSRVKLNYSGIYLVSTFYKGKGGSITFYVREIK